MPEHCRPRVNGFRQINVESDEIPGYRVGYQDREAWVDAIKNSIHDETGRQGWKLLCLVLIAVVLAIPVIAEPISSLKPSGYVNDFAGVLSAATRDELSEMCRQVELKAQAQIAVVTVKSTDGEDIFKYSVDLYQKWGIGQKGKDRGVLVLLAVQDRKYYTTVGYGLESILPDGKVGGFGREAVPYLKQGDYDGAVRLLASRVADVIAKDAGVEIAIPEPQSGQTTPDQPDMTRMSPVTIIILIMLGSSCCLCHRCAGCFFISSWPTFSAAGPVAAVAEAVASVAVEEASAAVEEASAVLAAEARVAAAQAGAGSEQQSEGAS